MKMCICEDKNLYVECNLAQKHIYVIDKVIKIKEDEIEKMKKKLKEERCKDN